ncbi:alpha-L-fucosidase [Streptomyces roseirectus]|uniref:alpha-L-fucosidase n=1 Tax=Streptomyces roseirectus TaxID=2768066 RepID=UPI001FECFCEA|nr:alpha-L-fucosidase [Streptomyces roseirectus]
MTWGPCTRACRRILGAATATLLLFATLCATPDTAPSRSSRTPRGPATSSFVGIDPARTASAPAVSTSRRPGWRTWSARRITCHTPPRRPVPHPRRPHRHRGRPRPQSLPSPLHRTADRLAEPGADGGFKLAILTVKHHDGLVLHPTRYTKRPAVLRRLHAAVRHQVGVHLSPADENQYLHGVYANGSTRARRTIPPRTAGDDRTPGRFRTLDATGYGAHMLNTLYEVLTEYGPVDEVWFDGAQGHARENEWNVIPVKENQYGRTDWALSCDTEVDRIRLAEVIREGRQVEAFVVEALRAGTRTQAARAQTMSAG